MTQVIDFQERRRAIEAALESSDVVLVVRDTARWQMVVGGLALTLFVLFLVVVWIGMIRLALYGGEWIVQWVTGG